MKSQKKLIVGTLVILVIFVLILVKCAPLTSQPPTATAAIVTTETPTETPTNPPRLTSIAGEGKEFTCVYYEGWNPTPTLTPQVLIDISAFLVDSQVIVTGPIDAINKMLDNLPEDIQLEPIELCDLQYQDNLPGGVTEQPEYPFSPMRTPMGVPPTNPANMDVPGQVMVLFKILDGGLVDNVTKNINQLGNENGVFADPNYLTGPLASSPCGGPNDPEGKPFEVGGSPFEVGGSPFEVGGSTLGAGQAQADMGIFWTQWAFTQTHIIPGQVLKNNISVFVQDHLEGVFIRGDRGINHAVPFNDKIAVRCRPGAVITDVSVHFIEARPMGSNHIIRISGQRDF